MDITNSINEIIEKDGDTVWAATDLSYSEFKEVYSRVIIVAQKFNHFITNDDYKEQEFRNLMTTIKISTDEKIDKLKELFDSKQIKNYIPPEPQKDEISLFAEFSFKYAAVKAGLGWIGKSGVLVTKAFGPRVRLGAIFIDYPLECGKTIDKSLCGNCRACIDACPWSFIKGNHWNIETKREELLDYQACNKKRSEFIELHGRKHACGYCIFACPIGIKTS